MSNIEMDLNEMRVFHSALMELVGKVQSRRIALERETSEVRKFWNDAKFQKFEREQEVLFLQIQVFEKLSESVCAYIARKVRLGEAYLQQ